MVADLRVEVDALHEHPEDGRLETEHEEDQDGLAHPRTLLVPEDKPFTWYFTWYFSRYFSWYFTLEKLFYKI